MDETPHTTNRRNVVTGIGLLAAGAVAGAVLAGTLAAGAASPSPSPSGSSTTENGVTGGHNCPGGHDRDGLGRNRVHLAGVVTAVGANTVTIKTATGTTTYTVNANSDIDKFGRESSLSKLVVGEKVRFSVRNGTKIIAKLHAGLRLRGDGSGANGSGASGSGANGSGASGSGGNA